MPRLRAQVEPHRPRLARLRRLDQLAFDDVNRLLANLLASLAQTRLDVEAQVEGRPRDAEHRCSVAPDAAARLERPFDLPAFDVACGPRTRGVEPTVSVTGESGWPGHNQDTNSRAK